MWKIYSGAINVELRYDVRVLEMFVFAKPIRLVIAINFNSSKA